MIRLSMHKKTIKNKHLSFFATLFHKPLLLLFILFILPFTVWGIQQTQQVISFGKNIAPLGNSYGTIDPIEKYQGGDLAPENHPDLNLALRGYVPTNGEKYPIVLGEGGDPKAPQIGKILSHVPKIVSLYRIYHWDWTANKKTLPMPLPDDPAASVKQIQMIGIQTSGGEPIKVPPVYGNPISPDYNAMVLFADDNSITLKYTREDNIGIKNGYAIQIEKIRVDPNLLALYNQLNSSGRHDLPAVSNEQVLGTAKDEEIRVVIRDTGDFLDPRSKLDWWQGIDYPAVPTEIVYNPTPTVYNPPPIPPTEIIANPTAIKQQPTKYVTYPTTYIRPQPTTNNQQQITPHPQPTFITIPTLTPTAAPAPFINIKMAVKSVQSTWEKFVISFIKFSKTILP